MFLCRFLPYRGTIKNRLGKGLSGEIVHDGRIARAAEKAGVQRLVTLNVRHLKKVCFGADAAVVEPQADKRQNATLFWYFPRGADGCYPYTAPVSQINPRGSLKAMVKKVQHLIEYSGLRLFAALVKMLPSSTAISLGRKTARLASGFLKNRIALAHDNLKIAYGDTLSRAERSIIIERLLCLQGESLIESILFTAKDAEKNIAVEGMEHLEVALSQNKGVLLLGPHFDMWELAGHVYGRRLRGAATIYKALKNPYVNNYLLKTRSRSNLGLISSKNALRPTLGKLRKGQAVVMLYDQNAGRTGLPVTFFNQTALTYSAPALFALKTGCAVIASYMIKEPGYRKHRLVIEKPFTLIKTGNHAQDLLQNTQQYNDFLEQLVRKHPEQWYGWLHKRWKLPSTYTPAAA